MTDFKDHGDILRILAESQDADEDNRQAARDAHLFIDKEDGQWEPYWWNLSDGKPRYTFDITGPVVDQIAGQIEQADFAIKVKPASGEASKDTAKLLDGLVRNIENISNASDIFSMAARNMITSGIDGWQVKQAYVDADSFDQDLVIEPIANFVDSVWLGPFTKPDATDMKWGVILEAVEKREYDERYPEGSGKSVSDGREGHAYFSKHDQITIGQLYYIVHEKRELVKLSDGRVVEMGQVEPVADELAATGITIVDVRNRPKAVVKSRLFDGGGWLKPAQKTVFNQIPIIPTFGNFKVFENKILYRGAVSKQMDAQRVLNYAKSREIEEGALAPRAKYFLTDKQVAGNESTFATLNTNADPVQIFTPDPENPGTPQQSGGGVINSGLRALSEDMRGISQQSAGLFASNMGDNPGLQSGVAIERLQQAGDIGTVKYFSAQERAICRTARILIDAIPLVYTGERQTRILSEDGSFDMTTLNQAVFDQQSMSVVTLNDLSMGKYDVTCSAGSSFQNRQQETVAAITELAPYDPSLVQASGDILFSSISAPGMDLIAGRKRQQLMQAGMIPLDQMTDEEKQQIEQQQKDAQQNPPPKDPMELAAEAEMGKAQAQTQKVMVDAQVAERREDRADFEAQQKAQQQAIANDTKQRSDEFGQFLDMQKQQMAQQAAILESISIQANTLKILREAMGVDSIVGPGNTAAYVAQAENLGEAIDQI